MKRFLHCLLAFVLLLALAVPVIAFWPENAAADAAAADGQITLKYLNPAYFQINDDTRTFSVKEGSEKKYETAYVFDTIDASQMSTYYNQGPEIEGWEFVGWYTAPVQYYFWGDTTETAPDKYELIPDGFKNFCRGGTVPDNIANGSLQTNGNELPTYWRWLYAVGNDGHKVESTNDLAGVDTLYALYMPSQITYYIDYNGWGTAIGTLTCIREYGTPFGMREPLPWPGYTFEGWFDKNNQKLDFYAIPENGEIYYTHWHKDDGSVSSETYKDVGIVPTNGIRFYDKPISDNPIYTLSVASCHPQPVNIYAKVLPENNGVTNLKWEVTAGGQYITVVGDGLSATITPIENALTGMETATATVTVTAQRADKTTYSQNLTVNIQAHAFGKSTITQWGNCNNKATIIAHECAYCTETVQDITYSSHQYAYRDIPATCTTPHIWQHYCKVCGTTDGNDIPRGKELGHNYTVTTTTGCGGTETIRTCRTCGLVETVSDASTASHNWSKEYTIDVRPTCAKAGSKSYKCLNCGATQPGSTVELPVDDSMHQWSDWQNVTEEAMEEGKTEGVEVDCLYRKCSICGAEEKRVALSGSVVKEQNDSIKENLKDKVTAANENTDKTAAEETVRATISSLLESNDALADDIRYASLSNPEAITAAIVVTPVTEANAREIKAQLGSDATTSYIDIDIVVKAGDQNIGRLAKTNDDITFRVPRPNGSGQYVTVLRSHDGDVEVIDSWPEGENGEYICFKSQMFSTFAVSVSDTPYTPPTSSSGGGGGGAAGGGGGGGGAASTANVSVSKSLQNGSVKVNDSGAEAGDTVKVTPQADAGYMVDQVTVTDKNGKAIEVKKNSDGTYSFVMPEEDRLPVTVTATFKVDPATGGPAAKFTDVNRDAWYRDGINFVLEHNLMQGVSADTFAPNATTTRGMIVTILYRLAGEPAASAGAFADVADGAWYADAIGWAAANGIVQGLSETQFAPNEPVTREQLAAILYRYEQKFGDGGFTGDWSYQLPFEDTAKMSDWAYEAMAWCNMNGVIDGMTAKTLEPAGNATRAQIATILMRFAADEAE